MIAILTLNVAVSWSYVRCSRQCNDGRREAQYTHNDLLGVGYSSSMVQQCPPIVRAQSSLAVLRGESQLVVLRQGVQ